MGLNTAQRAIIAERRQMVARLRCRHLSEREIVRQLDQQGHRNPDTHEPWSIGTVHADIVALEEAWRADALRNVAELKGIALAELREVKRKGWLDGDMDVVLKAMKQEADIKGLNAPVKQEHSGPDGGPIQIKPAYDLRTLTDEELATFEQLVGKATGGGALPEPSGDPDRASEA